MEEEIKQQTEGYEIDEVEELIFDKLKMATLSADDAALLAKYPKLSKLSFNGVGLKSLENFPKIESLIALELNDNKLSGDLQPLTNYPNLMTLSLGGNPIKELDTLKHLVSLQLANLDLLECPVTETQDYPSKVFEMFEDLAALDGKDKDGNEIESEDELDDDEDEEGDEDEEDEDDEEAEDEEDEGDEDEEEYEEGDEESDEEEDLQPTKKKQKTG